MCPLSTDRQTFAVTNPAIALNFYQALNVELNPFAQIAFNIALTINYGANPGQFIFAQIPDSPVFIDIRFLKNQVRA